MLAVHRIKVITATNFFITIFTHIKSFVAKYADLKKLEFNHDKIKYEMEIKRNKYDHSSENLASKNRYSEEKNFPLA